MKRIAEILISFILIFTLSVVSCPLVFAEDTSSADALNKIGLFLGTENGYELGRTLSRQEAIAMVVRLLGKEQEALEKKYEHPFKDVTDWASPYVGYAYKFGVTVGISDTEFGSFDEVTYCQYLTFLLRNLKYSDGENGDFIWDAPFELAKSIGLAEYTAGLDSKTKILREEVTHISWAMLKCKYKDSDVMLYSDMIKAGVFTDADYKEAEKIKNGSGSANTEFTVNFVSEGKIISTQKVKKGENAKEPATPTKSGYVFNHWDTSFTNVSSDLTVTAVFSQIYIPTPHTEKTYTVKFVDFDGEVLSKQTVVSGSAAKSPENPERSGYRFTGWDKAFSKITADTVITAQYEEVIYTVRFVDHNGITIGNEQHIQSGKSATAPTAPKRVGYTFTGWDKAFNKITADTVITATYTETKYTVKFVGKDGKTTIKTQTVKYGEAATAPTAPTITGFVFKEWDKDFSKVTSNMTVKAIYEDTNKKSDDDWTGRY